MNFDLKLDLKLGVIAKSSSEISFAIQFTTTEDIIAQIILRKDRILDYSRIEKAIKESTKDIGNDNDKDIDSLLSRIRDLTARISDLTDIVCKKGDAIHFLYQVKIDCFTNHGREKHIDLGSRYIQELIREHGVHDFLVNIILCTIQKIGVPEIRIFPAHLLIQIIQENVYLPQIEKDVSEFIQNISQETESA